MPPCRVGQWLPSDRAILDEWLLALAADVERERRPLQPAVQRLKVLVEAHAEIFMLFTQMFEQLSHKPPYNKDPSGKPQVRSWQHALDRISAIMTRAPSFDTTALVGFPINV